MIDWRPADPAAARLPAQSDLFGSLGEGFGQAKRAYSNSEIKYVLYIQRESAAKRKAFNKAIAGALLPRNKKAIDAFHFIFSEEEDFNLAANLWPRKTPGAMECPLGWQFAGFEIHAGPVTHHILLIRRGNKPFANEAKACTLINDLLPKQQELAWKDWVFTAVNALSDDGSSSSSGAESPNEPQAPRSRLVRVVSGPMP